ncbi:hypothetical protein F2Q69_00022860 [Brassica cretica]|uniref:Arabidopsis retrotransposon Orf1 C-terminal domain-containing protein n=1 Tax=Brassica cretica TaxID=69181 RepID=A0A8S9QAS5_BRACR|nr:hypothetical protein F2Q69_00022860 [Brassica cretica]
MADGEYCSLSLDKLNEIYETATEPKGIRNPVLRVIAKIISNLLFAKDLTSKVTNGELQTLYAGIEDDIRASGHGIPIQKVKMNPGFNFMTMICERRQCLMHEVQYLNIKYLMACHIMRDEETYSFFDKAGTQLFTKLPHPEITRFNVFDNIRFLPPPELLCTDPRAAVPDADKEDVEDITTEVEPSYDLGELADVTDDQAYRRWMVDSQRKNNSLMRRILHLITEAALAEVTSDSLQQSILHDRTDKERRLWEQALRPRRFIARATDVLLIQPRAASPTESARTILYPFLESSQLKLLWELGPCDIFS